jgi:predicted restriction endonuclease
MTNLALPPLPVLIDDNETLGQEITLLAGQINAANHRLLKMIAEFDSREGWSGGGTVRSCAHWLNWKCGIALGAGREKVRVAHALEELPLIDAAFASGEISYSKVRAMTRVATPENEDFLLRIAQHGTASHVEKAVAKYRSVQTNDADAAERKQGNDRKLVYYRDQDGMWVIHAKLPPEAGAMVIKAIEAVANPVDEEDVSAETSSEALQQQEKTRYQELLDHTRADALASIAEHFLASANETTALQALKGSERCQLVLHVDINTLRQHHSESSPCHEHCHMEDKHWISPNTARRLSCDTSLITVLEDAQGRVLNIGRKTRTVPSNISRALSLRDKTCRFPGCCESRYIDAHHIRHWADGGETSLDNLVTLCRYHHRQLHSGSFSIRAVKTSAGQELQFTTPSGREIESSLFPQFARVSAETSRRALLAIAPEVDSTTAVTRWRGEDCDYGMVVEGLLGRDGGG